MQKDTPPIISSHPLLNRMIACIFFFGAIMAVSLTLINIYYEYRREISGLKQYLNSLQESQLQVLSKNVWGYNTDTITTQLNSILLYPEILFLELEVTNGGIYKVGKKPSSNMEIVTRVFPLTYRYKDNDIHVGEFTVYAVTNGIKKRLLTKLPRMIAIEFFKMFFICTFILIIFYFFFTRHLQEIALQAKGIDFDNLDQPLLLSKRRSVDTPDELDHIVGALNEMKKRLQKGMAEQEKLEAELRQAQKLEAIGTLAGGIAHDFNNILSVIVGYSEIALLKFDNSSKVEEALQEIHGASLKARDLVQQILTFSRKSEHSKQPLQISIIVKETAKMLRSSIPSAISIKTQIQNGNEYILGDPTQIHQVLMNLCTNAYHAMRDTDGILGISLKAVRIKKGEQSFDEELEDGNYLELVISDNGSGIESAHLEKIFEPYFTTKDVGEGTGLGLAVVHGIVKDHQGMIRVFSTPGEGTTFHIFFPTIEKEGYVSEEDEEEMVSANPKRHILFVDDEEKLLAIARDYLSECGYGISTYSLAEDALEVFSKNPAAFDIVITDMSMPKMSGAVLVQKILTIRTDIPVILCSGYSEFIDEESALALGCSAYVSKPVTMRQLKTIIEEIFNGGGKNENN